MISCHLCGKAHRTTLTAQTCRLKYRAIYARLGLSEPYKAVRDEQRVYMAHRDRP